MFLGAYKGDLWKTLPQARPGNGAKFKTNGQTESRFLFYTRLGTRAKSLAEISPGKGLRDSVITAQDCIKLKEANYTTLLGHRDKSRPSVPGHCSESSEGSKLLSEQTRNQDMPSLPSQA